MIHIEIAGRSHSKSPDIVGHFQDSDRDIALRSAKSMLVTYPDRIYLLYCNVKGSVTKREKVEKDSL